MIKILDRYILKNYLSKFFASMIAFTVTFMIVDVIDHLDKFIDSSMPRIEIFRYYLYTFPWFISIGLPMSFLLAAVFSMGLLQKRNELTAIKASGISIHRISIPLLIIGITASGLSFYFDNLVVAPSLNKRAYLEETFFQKRSSRWSIKKKDIFRHVRKDEILGIKRYAYKTNTAYNISLQKYQNDDIIYRLDAPTMNWDESSNAWRIPRYRTRTWGKNGQFNYTYTDSDTLLKLNFTPVDLTSTSVKPEEMNYWELAGFVKKLKQNGIKDPRWEVNLHYKTAFACSSLLMILFGLSLSIGKPRSNLAVGMGISIFVIFLYYGALKFGQTLGYKEVISPFMATWSSNLIFLLAGSYLFFKTRT